MFWNTNDLQRELSEFQAYYNEERVHASLACATPMGVAIGESVECADLDDYRWASHSRGLVQLPIAACWTIRDGQVLVGTRSVAASERFGEMLAATAELSIRVIDAASSTFGVRLELPNPGYALPAGRECEVRFQRNED